MSDAGAPEPDLRWAGDGNQLSFLGCVGLAAGVIFMLTGGLCAWIGLSESSFGSGAIGLFLIVSGWALMKMSK